MGKTPRDIDRRTVLRSMGVSAAAITIGSTAASANSDEILASNAVAAILDAAGDPDTLFVETEQVQLDGIEAWNEPLEAVKIGTEVGTILYVDDDGKEMAHLTFDQSSRGQLPRRFQRAPNSVEVGVTYERGEVRERREATPAESNRVADVLSENGIESDDISAYYDAIVHEFFVGCEDGAYRIELPGSGTDSSVSDTYVPSLRTGDVAVSSIMDGEDEVSTQDHCYSLGGPCAACAAGSGSCGLCGITCMTGALPVCGACLALSCGFGGVACGCCLGCLDGHEVTHECTDYI